MSSIVEVKLELGHRAKVREEPHPDGYTHDWVVFVKGTDGIKLEHFVEKVVFWLHESYESNKVVLRQPPYKVAQSGFAGFNMLIYVHFRNREEPKMVRFEYDLFLHTEAMPPVNHTRLEKLTFTNPTEDFRKKLVRAGSLLINQNSDGSKVQKSSSKDRPGGVVSPIPKKDKSRSNRDGSKHREGSLTSSSNKPHEERKRSSSHSKKDAGRIPGKDMKRHEEHFKLPLPAKTSKESDFANKINPQPEKERGRTEKRRSATGEDEGSKKKKKKRSEDLSSKSPIVSSGSSTSNQQKKDKDRKRKIKEKADVMAGLFAPENSINIKQIKKEKIKQEDSKIVLKKEKTPNLTPTRNTPYPVQEDVQPTSKVSPVANLTLKIKKERITSVEKERKVKESSNSMNKKRDSVDKEKKKSKDYSSKTKTHAEERKVEVKRSPIVSTDSSASDMDISEAESSHDEKQESKKIRTSPTKFHVTSKTETKVKPVITPKPPEIKNTKVSTKTEPKHKIETNRPFKNSPTQSKPSDKQEKEKKKKSDSHKEKKSSSSSVKHKKSSKDKEVAPSVSITKENSKHKKQKRSSKEKQVKKSSKDGKLSTPTPSVKIKELSSTPNTDRISIKKAREDYSSPGGVFSENTSPMTSNKSKNSSVSPKPSSQSHKKKDTILIKKSSSKKPSSNSKSTPLLEDKPKTVYKSRSFVETSSDNDSDLDHPPPAPEPRKKTPPVRKDSMSSQSSAFSDNHSHITSEDEKPPPALNKFTPHPSSSESSEDEMEMSGFPPGNSSKLSVISPIGERSHSHTENTIDATLAYQDMQMSSSSDESPPHEQPDHEKNGEDDVPENHHPSRDINHQESSRILQDLVFPNDMNASSDEDSTSPLEKPFQYHLKDVDVPHPAENFGDEDAQGSSQEDLANVLIGEGNEINHYPHMNDTLYQELQELQRKLSFVTDVERLRKIASIVSKSQKLLKNDEYFDFDLCALDHRTINKIQKQLKAV